MSGRTLLSKGDFPYIKEKAYADVKTFQPDIAIIMLGTNDAKPQNWKFEDEFASDYSALIAELRALPSHPLIMLCLPVPAYGINFSINDRVVNNQVVPMVKTIAKQNKTLLVDLYKPFSGHPEWFLDHIHPTKAGAGEMAQVLAKALVRTGRRSRAGNSKFKIQYLNLN